MSGVLDLPEEKVSVWTEYMLSILMSVAEKSVNVRERVEKRKKANSYRDCLVC